MTLRPAFLVLVLALCCFDSSAQSEKLPLVNSVPAKSAESSGESRNTPDANKPAETSERVTGDESRLESSRYTDAAATANPQFRVERMAIGGGAELLTIFGRLDGMRTADPRSAEVPLISVLRDTLSDADPDNDRLRYVWMLSYTRPNLLKRVAAAVPFLYQHVENQTASANGPPKPIIDLGNSRRQTWNRFFWMGVQNVFLDSYGLPIKASTRTYRRNLSDYRAGHVFQALSILDNYERLRSRARDESELLAFDVRAGRDDSLTGSNPIDDAPKPVLSDLTPVFTPGEMLEIRARLIMSGKTFGGLLGPSTFRGTVTKRFMSSIDTSGHNWELLRQRAEAEGLYFQPLAMPDGQATHAILWVAKADLEAQSNRKFDDRFLNISNPWSDGRLRKWNGYSRTIYLDQDNRPVIANNPDARAVNMIPLALYGLDHPKIPALLIDFRDHLNPKKREMSRRILNDLANNILSLSSFGNLPYFAGRKAYEFITGRRGMDLNQPTRLRTYSELKLLLSFNPTIDPKLRDEIERRVQNVSLNPLNNDNESEMRLARQQYDALIRYATRENGLPAKIERDRRAEMMPLKHGSTGRFFYNLANVLSFGRYVHRETATPELYARLETSRRIEYHTNFLKQVAKLSPQTEIAWDIAAVKQSLQFLATQGAGASDSTAKAAAAILQRTEDPEARQLCLDALSTINNQAARAELLRIYRREPPQSEIRAKLADRLRKAVAADPHIKPSEAKSLLTQVGEP